MPGFPREEQRLLARLVGGHRRKLSLDGVEELVPPWDRLALYADRVAATRRAVAPGPQPDGVAADRAAAPPPNRWRSNFRRRWLEEHPLTSADLQQETEYLRANGFRLRVFSRDR